MSKLDVIILKCSNAVLDLPKTNDPLGKPIDEASQSIKSLFLEIIGEDEPAPEIPQNNYYYRFRNEQRAVLRQKVEEL